MEVLKMYLGQTVIDEHIWKPTFLTTLFYYVWALFIKMKNLGNQMSNIESFGKIYTKEFNEAIYWRRIVVYNMRKCLQHTG